jgi:hypothetical protein
MTRTAQLIRVMLGSIHMQPLTKVVWLEKSIYCYALTTAEGVTIHRRCGEICYNSSLQKSFNIG